MKILNLSNIFITSSIAAIQHKTFIFNGGEPHVKLKIGNEEIDPSEEVLVVQRVCSSDDFMLLLLASDALRRVGYSRLSALVPYFPAARQDRVMVSGEPLSVKVYAQIINAQGYERVWVFDPHSEVTPALLENVGVISNENFIKKTIQHIGSESLVLIAPDAGASKKLHKLSAQLGHSDVVLCGKQRDVRTGQLTSFEVFSDDLAGRDCLIVDDICDGGRTFIGIAEALKAKNAGRVFLAVSHGIFSDGLEKFDGLLDGIFTTDSFKEISHELVVQYKFSSLISDSRIFY